MKHARVLLCLAMFLGAGAVCGQQVSSPQGSGGGEQAAGESAGRNSATSAGWHGSGIVADNLDRVAATAEQILEVLNRDAGLMVELKRAMAQDAGESGQILEESDLSESAVTERLREDLRTRVLATRLLRKYGYLLPKLNPDSDLAQEQRLVFQERAQELARAAERNYQPRGPAPAEQFADCDSKQTDCELLERTPQRTRAYSNEDGHDAIPANQAPQPGERPAQPSRPELLRTEDRESGSTETLLAASSQGYAGGVSSRSNGRGGGVSREGTSLPAATDSLGVGNPANDPAFTGGATRPNPRDFERRYNARGGSDRASLEPVRMVHRPNPYADAG